MKEHREKSPIPFFLQTSLYLSYLLHNSMLKELEKVAENQIMKYLNKLKQLYEHQYGFRAKHNTTQPLFIS